MAAGDIHWFDAALLALGSKVHNLGSDTLRLGLVTAGTTPSKTTANPTWGAGGTNLSTNAVATGTAYTGPVALATPSWSLVAGVPTLRAADVSIAQDAAGFVNARWGVIYNDTAAGKPALAFVDLGSDRSIVGGPLAIDWGGAGTDILTITGV